MKKVNVKSLVLCVFVLLALSFSCATVYNTADAQTIVSGVPYYDENLNCYVQITTETYTEYYEQLGCNVVKKRTTTTYYTYNDNNYILINQTFKDEIVSYDSLVTASPTAIPTYNPQQTPEGFATPVPSASAEPTRVPIGLTSPEIEVNRKSDTKAKIKWKTIPNADGYIIYRSDKEKSGYSKVKNIKDGLKNSYTESGLKGGVTYYYKVRAYQNGDTDVRYTNLSEPEQLVTMSVKKIQTKLDKIKKMYPDGMYWNHVKYKVSGGQSTYGFVTRYPCKHNGRLVMNGTVLNNMSSTCNYYKYVIDGKNILGYQCAGFAAMLNDKLFGTGRFRTFKDYNKAKVGDCARYKNHSVVIISKHSDYIRVAECNYGNECMIKWGRKISRKTLKNAVFYGK